MSNRLRRTSLGVALCLCALAVPVSVPRAVDLAQTQPAAVTAVTGAMVLEAAGRPPRLRERLVISNGRITCLGSAAECRIPDDARTIDGRGKWVIPGLIDAHVHISEDGQPGVGALYISRLASPQSATPAATPSGFAR
jgi:hypothetical protein